MVFYFEARGGYQIYMGRDKYENELLIKHGWPEDIWFHVDDLSSAHVYLRLKRGTKARKVFRETGRLDHLPEVLEDCTQLVKANSIEGCKKASVSVCYTPWENLKKTASMVDGQVGFHDRKAVIHVRDVPKTREIVNRINKTKEESHPDLRAERIARDEAVARARKKKMKLQAEKKKKELAKLRAEKDARDYKHIMKEEDMTSNADVQASEDVSAAVDFEDDFM